ncbi:MAG: DUF1304 domain-containing protein [Alphaproteobacteria bacterium]|nr:DUF1304 domain-containing protein [Alphaproteobacteria bacterium]
MKAAAKILVFCVAALHIWFLVLEMFLWNHPIGRNAFGLTAEDAETMAVMAANQGLYNGFLAAGLFWGLFSEKRDIMQFFLACIVVAGVYGGMTAKASIIWIQAAPAIIAFVLVSLSYRPKKI